MKHDPHVRGRSFLRGLTLSSSALLSASVLCAQAVSSPPVASVQDDEPVELSPFVVETTQDVGYLASNTLAGSRLNTALKDTPAAISVFTSEFLADIGAFDLKEAMTYAVNAEFDLDDDRTAVNGNATVASYQTYRIRGLPASMARNYFKWDLPSESALLERIEDSRGPNSVLFGMASPGGLINQSSKQARGGRAFQNLSVTLMSNESYRGTLDLNQPSRDGRFAVRLNAVYNQTNSHRHYQYQEHKRVHVAAKYDISRNTRIRGEFERGQIDSNQPRNENLMNSFLLWDASGRPTVATQSANSALGISRITTNAAQPRWTYITNNDMTISMRGTLTTTSGGPWGDNPITDTSIADRSINVGGVDQDRFSRFDALSLFLEHQFNDKTFLEVAYNHQDHIFDRYDPRTGSPQVIRGDPNQFLNGGAANPFAGRPYIEAAWYKMVKRDQSDTARAMLSTELDAGKWGNYRIAGLGEFSKSFAYGLRLREMWYDAVTGLPAANAQPHNANNLVYRRAYPTEGQWDTYHVSAGGQGFQLLSDVTDPFTGRKLYSDWVPASASVPGESYEDLKSYMAALQARFFKGRLIAALGFRRDNLSIYNLGTMVDPVTQRFIVARDDSKATSRLSRTSNTGDTKTLGVMYHVLPWLSVFYNWSDNTSLPDDNFRLPDSGEPGNPIPLEAPKGETEDYGMAFSFLNGKISARATYYSTAAVDQSTTSPSPVRDANVRIMNALFNAGLVTQAEVDFRTDVGGHGVFDFRSEGVEVQVTANPTDNWRFTASYAHTNAVQENLFNEWKNWHQLNLQYLSQFPIDTIMVNDARTIRQDIDYYLTTANGLNDQILNDGQNRRGNRKHKASVFTRYSFSSGPLRGFYVGGGYRYQSKMFTGLESETNRREVWAPCVGEADLMAGYTVRRMSKGRRLSFQLNIINVLDETDPIVTRYDFSTGEQRISAFVPREPLNWRFTTNFEF